MTRPTFPDAPMSAEEVARSIRREQGIPEPSDPNELYYWEVTVEKTLSYTIEVTDADDARQRYYDGDHLGDETIDEHVWMPRKMHAVKQAAS